MITVKLIRGYKLFLWAERLGIRKEYASAEVDITEFYYVHSVIPVDDLSSRIILISPVVSGKGGPTSIIFEALNATLNLLIETFEIED